MKRFIFIIFITSCCKYPPNIPQNFQYISNKNPSYYIRDKETSGNCLDYAYKCFDMLLSTGISHDRIEILGCAANNGECHAVTVLDKVYVYDVNYNHVVRKNSLTYEWYLKIL